MLFDLQDGLPKTCEKRRLTCRAVSEEVKRKMGAVDTQGG